MRASLVVSLVIVLIILTVAAFFVTNPEAGQQVLVDLELATPAARHYITSGILEVERTDLSSLSGGRVAQILVTEGERVQAGQPLVILESTLMAAQRELAVASLAVARARLGALNSGARQADLAVAQAAVAYAQVGLDGAQKGLEDARRNSADPVRQEQEAVAQARVERARADLDTAQASLDLLSAGPGEVEIAPLQTALEIAVAELAAIDDQIAHLTIKAPHSGVILERLMKPGELALPGWPVITLADIDQVEITVYIPAHRLGQINLGETAWIRVDAYPGRLFAGEVVEIADQAEFTPRNVQVPEERVFLVHAVTIAISNLDGALRPGLPADAIFEAGS